MAKESQGVRDDQDRGKESQRVIGNDNEDRRQERERMRNDKCGWQNGVKRRDMI